MSRSPTVLRWTARALAAVMTLLTWTSDVAAQPAWDTPGPTGLNEAARSGGEVELGFWVAGLDDDAPERGSFSGLARLGIVLDEVAELRLVAGGAWGDLGADGTAGSAANPLVSAYGIVDEDRWRLRLGGGASIPAAPLGISSRRASYLAASTRGLEELWLWSADRLAVIADASLVAIPVDHLYLDARVQAGVLFPIDRQIPVTPNAAEEGRSAVDLSIDARAAIGVRLDNFLGGLRLRGVFSPTFRTEQVQSSLQLFLRGTGRLPDTSVELFGEMRLDTNLDDDLGFGFAQNGRWGVFLTLGAAAAGRQIPEGRRGVRRVEVEGAEEMDAESLIACLGTRERARTSFDIGVRGTPECGEPPFDGNHLIVDLWHWPWSTWPLFDANVLERDIERVERWYRARGFYEARVESFTVIPSDASGEEAPQSLERDCPSDSDCTVDVRITVDEGEPVTIARLDLIFDDGTGNVTLPEEVRARLRRALPLSVGDRFDETIYDNAKRSMRRLLAENGYANSSVDGAVKVNPGRREAYLALRVRAGLLSVVGRVCVSGHRTGDGSLPGDSLLYIAGLEAGEELTLGELENAQRGLYALGVFRGVEIAPRSADTDAEEAGSTQNRVCQEGPPPEQVPAGASAVDLDIRVSPGRLERGGVGVGLQAGNAVSLAGASTIDPTNQNAAQWDLHFSATYEHRNLFDRLVRTRLEIRPRLIFEMPALLNWEPAFDPPLGIQTSVSFRWPAFIEGRTNLVVQARHDLGPTPFTNFYRSEVDGVLGLERAFFDDRLYIGGFLHGNWFLPTDRQPSDPTQRLPETGALWLEERVRVDLRDNPTATTAGFYLEATAQQSVQPLSSWDLIRWDIDARGYIPIFDTGVVLAMRFEIGGMHVLGFSPGLDDNNVYQLTDLGPSALQLRGGGASSHRGYLPGLLGDATQVYVDTPRSDNEIALSSPARRRAVRLFGGTRLWEASIEVRVPITTELGAVVFADAGDLSRPSAGTDSAGEWRFDHPQLAFGLGLRYRTLIGPLRLDIAFRPDELQTLTSDSRLPPTCSNVRASGCNPRSYIDLGFGRIPGAYHLTFGESF